MVPPGNTYEAVLLFDGVCGLCNGVVDFILRHDRCARIGFAALQSAAGQRLLGEYGLSPDSLHSVVLIEHGRCVTESTAVLAAARHLGYPWRLVTVFRLVPRPLRDGVYRLVAKRRYAWFGRRETCRVPSHSERERFIE